MATSYKKIFNSPSAPVIVVDAAGKILYVNDELARLSGCRCVDIRGTSRLPFFSPADRKTFKSLVRGAVKNNRVASFSLPVSCADRSVIDVRWTTVLLQEKADRKPEAVALVGSVAAVPGATDTDIEEIEERYRVIFENSGIGMAFIREDSTIALANRELEKITGYAKSEIEGRMKWSDFVANPEDLGRLMSYHRTRRIDAGAVPGSYDIKVRVAGGEIRDVLFRVTMIPGTTYSLASVIDITDRMRAEETLRASEEKYRSLVNNMQDTLYRCDVAGNVTFVSPSVKPLLSVASVDDLIGRNIANELYPNPADRAILLEKLKKDGSVTNHEVALKRRDGKIVHLVTNSHLYYDGDGNVLGVEGVFRDITEQKSAEAALHESEEQYRSLVNNLQDAVYRSNIHGDLSFITPSGARSLGYETPDEIIGLNIADSFYCDPGQRDALMDEMTRHGMVTNFEVQLKRRGGGSFTALVNSHLLYDKNGVLLGVEGIFTDITDRIVAEENVKSSRKLLHEILQAASEFSIIATDPEGTITTFNRGAELMLGYSAEEAVGKMSLLDFHLDSEVAWRGADLSARLGYRVEGFRVFAVGPELDGPETREWTYVRKDGSRLDVSLVVSAMRSEDGGITGYVGIANDITIRKKMENEANMLAAVVRHSSEMVSLAHPDGRVVFINEAGLRMLGIDPEETEKSNIMQVVPDNLKGVVENELLPCLMEGKNWEGDLQYKNLKTGRVTDVHALAFTIDDPGSRSHRYLANISLDITRRKRAEEESRQAEEKFTRIFMLSPECIALTRVSDGMLVDVNLGFEMITGWQRWEAVGKTSLQIGFWADPANRDAMVTDLRAGREILNREFRFARKDGSVRDGVYSARGIRVGGEPHLVFILNDVTERRETERIMREKDERLRGITENMPGVVYQFYAKDDGECGISYASERVTEVFGLEGDRENFFRDFLAGVHEDDRARFVESIRKAVETRAPWNFEARYNKPSGQMIWFHGLSLPTRYDDRLVFDGIMLNVTERKHAEERSRQAEEALRHSEQRFRSIVENANDIIFMATPEGTFSYLSPAWQEILGEPAADAVGKNFGSYVHPDDFPMMREHVDRVVTSGQAIKNVEFRGIRHDGSIFWLSVITSPLRDAGGNITGLMGIARDVTARRRTDEVLRASLEEKEVLLKELYHRTKNNMQVICGLLKLESTRTENGDLHSVFNDIENRIQTMALVHQKLYESNDLANISLPEFVASLSALIMKNYAPPPGTVTISQEVDSLRLSIDTIMPLGMVVNELLTNSIKHAFPGGRKGAIRIEMKAGDDCLLFDYRDDGIGLPAGFDPGATATLGMNIVRNIAQKQLGGDVRFFSDNGFRCAMSLKTNLYRRRV